MNKKHLISSMLFIICLGCNSNTPHKDETPSLKIPGVPGPEATAIFDAKCASCHQPLKDCGYSIQGSLARWTDTPSLKAFVKNSKQVIASGNPYAVNLYSKWNKVPMPAFPDLTDKEFELLLEYMK